MDRHRIGVNEAFLVKHRLKLTGLSQQNVEQARYKIENTRGIDSIELRVDISMMSVSYDASITSISSIFDLLQSESIEPAPDWWNQLKLSWDKQIDQNVRDNAKHVPHCCNKPPQRK